MKRKDKLFWFLFIGFCASAVAMIKFSNRPGFTNMDNTADGIMVGLLLLCGIAIRYWIYKNPEEMKRRFKIDEE